MNPVVEAQGLLTFAARMLERLALAIQHQEALPGADEDERGWLLGAVRRLNQEVERTTSALQAAAALPELGGARRLKGEALANAWADAVERVFDGIVANVSANGPLVEALFPHQRFTSLRRPGNAAQKYWLEFERRAASAYVRRLCSDPEYQFLPALLEAARAAERQVREREAPLPLEDAEALRETVRLSAAQLELALRQSRSLCEAAFARAPKLLAELGLDAKPQRRATRSESAAPS
jgi:hypothetical protein